MYTKLYAEKSWEVSFQRHSIIAIHQFRKNIKWNVYVRSLTKNCYKMQEIYTLCELFIISVCLGILFIMHITNLKAEKKLKLAYSEWWQT